MPIPRDGGRAKPKVCSKATFELIMVHVANGERTYKALEIVGSNFAAFYGYLNSNKAAQEKYTLAKNDGLERRADEIEEISAEPPRMVDTKFGQQVDVGWEAYRKQRLDTSKWVLSKLAFRRYGDKVTQEVTGVDGGPVQVQQVATDYNALRASLPKRVA